ncbi:hypothetical protein [Haliovirga abyssi]|nr:hypothetical protein [Haliovirga abyssi]
MKKLKMFLDEKDKCKKMKDVILREKLRKYLLSKGETKDEINNMLRQIDFVLL